MALEMRLPTNRQDRDGAAATDRSGTREEPSGCRAPLRCRRCTHYTDAAVDKIVTVTNTGRSSTIVQTTRSPPQARRDDVQQSGDAWAVRTAGLRARAAGRPRRPWTPRSATSVWDEALARGFLGVARQAPDSIRVSVRSRCSIRTRSKARSACRPAPPSTRAGKSSRSCLRAADRL